MELSLGGISYRRPADFRTTLETEARMPPLKLYELDNVEGQRDAIAGFVVAGIASASSLGVLVSNTRDTEHSQS